MRGRASGGVNQQVVPEDIGVIVPLRLYKTICQSCETYTARGRWCRCINRKCLFRTPSTDAARTIGLDVILIVYAVCKVDIGLEMAHCPCWAAAGFSAA